MVELCCIMLKIRPTHIGLDIALNIMQELQPATSVRITKEFLEIINVILNKSIGLGCGDLYRIADRILTLIPFKIEFLERIFRYNIHNNIDMYLIHIFLNDQLCYYAPLTTMNEVVSASLIKVSYEKIIPIEL